MSLPSLEQLYNTRRARLEVPEAKGTLVALDPGGTTGYAIFNHLTLQEAGQLDTGSQEEALKLFEPLLGVGDRDRNRNRNIDAVVMEDHRVYQNRIEQHAGSSLSTPRLIGMIETLCLQHSIPWHKQPASMPKQFVTDEKLKAWGLYLPGKRHARDAIRHACYFILFPPKILGSQSGVHRSKTAGQHVG